MSNVCPVIVLEKSDISGNVGRWSDFGGDVRCHYVKKDNEKIAYILLVCLGLFLNFHLLRSCSNYRLGNLDLFFVFDCFVLWVLILVLFVFCLEVVFLPYLQLGMTRG